MKKILLLLLVNILTISVAFAENVEIYFHSEGATSVSSNMSLENNFVYHKSSGKNYATYTTNDIITGINKIEGETFTISKTGKQLIKGAEWYAIDKNGKVYYYNQSGSYNMGNIAKEAGVINGSLITIDLHANWGKPGATFNPSNGNSNFSLSMNSYKMKVGAAFTLRVNADDDDVKLNWSSSNTSVATVNNNGYVKALKVGKAVITVLDNKGRKATCSVEVVKNSVHSVFIRYNMNGGKLNDFHGSKITDSWGSIKCKGESNCKEIVYGSTTTSSGLANYNNPNYINLYRKGYVINKKAAWNTQKNGKGTSYSQYGIYKATDFCEASKLASNDCVVTLYANWVKADTKYNIALIGNSKTKFQSNDKSRVSTIFEKMTSAAGYKADIDVIVRGGSSLNYKATKDPYMSDIKKGNFNYVVLQEETETAINGGKKYNDGFSKTVSLLKNKNAKVFLRTSWPKKNSKTYKSDLNNMINNASSIAKANNATLVNDGKAFDMAMKNGLVVYLSDNNHPTTEGAYLAAACIYKNLYGVKATSINYYYGIKASTAQKLLLVADDYC